MYNFFQNIFLMSIFGFAFEIPQNFAKTLAILIFRSAQKKV